MSTPHNKIGFWPLTSLVTGNLVGSGVFLLPATLATFGTLSLFGWLSTSVGALFLALVFAYLSFKIPQTGGPYAYVREAFGRTPAFYVCWGYWMLSWISNAALVVAAAGYLTTITGELPKTQILLLELGTLLTVMFFNLFAIQVTGRGELIITILKVIPLIILPICGLAYVDGNNFSALTLVAEGGFWENLNRSAFLCLWAFIGLETGTVPGGQVEKPKRNIPAATIFGTTVAALIYILGSFVIFGVVPPEQLMTSKAPYADAANIIFGGNWGPAIAIAAVVSCVGALNGWILIVGRIPQAAANEGLFPKIFAKTSKSGTPTFGIVFSSILTMTFALLSLNDSLVEQFYTIIDIAVTLILLIYFACIMAFFKIGLASNTRVIIKSCVGGVALMFVCWGLWATSFKMLASSLVILLVGLPFKWYIDNTNAKS